MKPLLHTNGDALRVSRSLCDQVLEAYDSIVIGLYDYASADELEGGERILGRPARRRRPEVRLYSPARRPQASEPRHSPCAGPNRCPERCSRSHLQERAVQSPLVAHAHPLRRRILLLLRRPPCPIWTGQRLRSDLGRALAFRSPRPRCPRPACRSARLLRALPELPADSNRDCRRIAEGRTLAKKPSRPILNLPRRGDRRSQDREEARARGACHRAPGIVSLTATSMRWPRQSSDET
jgi:hypothetical protein